MSISLKPTEAIDGGFMVNGKYMIDRARFCEYDYQGKSQFGSIMALRLELSNEDGPTKSPQYLKIGPIALYALSSEGEVEDDPLEKDGEIGTQIESREGKDDFKLLKSCDMVVFLDSLVKAGFPEARLESGDVSVLDGIEIIVDMKGTGKKDSKDREKKVITVEKVLSAGTVKKGGKGKAASVATTAKPKAKVKVVVDEDEEEAEVEEENEDEGMAELESITLKSLKKYIAANNGGTQGDAAAEVLAALKKSGHTSMAKEIKPMLNKIIDTDWLDEKGVEYLAKRDGSIKNYMA